MIKCLNSNSLHRANTFDDLLDQTIQLGFAGLELNLNQNLELNPEINNETLTALFEKARLKNVEILSLTTCSKDLFDLSGENEEIRNAALEYFQKLIDSAAPPGAIAVIPAHQKQPLGSIPPGSYEQSFNHLFFSLQTLAAHAEKKSTRLALETPGSGLLLSPLELRELIDQVNNPYLGVCLNPHYVEKNTNPLDWCNILELRILILHFPVEKLSKDFPHKYRQILDLLQNKNISLPAVHLIHP